MTDLSPAAQAVLKAVTQREYSLDPEDIPSEASRLSAYIAPALRAAAYQVAPPRPVLDSCCDHFEQAIRHKILAIADELDPPTS